ncbi:hypothetical protein HPB52_018606 [Rhipicephalus sanguineus]|uniref:Nlr family card domain protein n=1 Tax=Rhipicephalus sanguineus TaxID=34632 RepID=A0A9D4ST03_RHISA|nr:hypothetical protein HPB52_018606 [Rhipicephalus sanguineus]
MRGNTVKRIPNAAWSESPAVERGEGAGRSSAHRKSEHDSSSALRQFTTEGNRRSHRCAYQQGSSVPPSLAMSERDGRPKALCGLRRRPMPLLADMDSARSYFSGSIINYRTPCSSNDGRLCHIFGDLPLWNEFFWQVGLELRELAPGELSLADVRASLGQHAYVPYVTLETVHESATLLHHLLTLHRCVVSVDLNGYALAGHSQLVCDSLRESPSLRKLKFCLLQLKPQASHSFAATLLHLNHLRELDVRSVLLDETVLEGLSKFLASTESLTALFTGHLPNHRQEAVVLLRGLQRNSDDQDAVTLLVYGGPCLVPVRHRFRRVHARNQDAAYPGRGIVPQAIINNATLSVLNLLHFSMDVENMQYIAWLLSENKTLTSFNMFGCFWYEPEPEHGADSNRMENCGSFSSRIQPWLRVLAENNTLVQITLDLSWFNREECWALLKALASHASIKKIFVQRIRNEDVAEICRATRNTGILQRLIFCENHAISDPVVMLTECKEAVFVSFDSTVSDESLRTTLSLLRSSDHVSSLCLTVGLLNTEVSTLIAQYISRTTALGHLELSFLFIDIGNAVARPERALVRALSVNKSIRSLLIQGPCFDETEARALADTLTSSRTVFSVSFFPEDCRSVLSLIHRLSSRNFSTNYALTEMRLTRCVELGADWFAVSDVVRRNDSLVKRATQFVKGTSSHKYCAAALELVHFNAALVATVKRHASVDANEAVLRIKRSLKSFSEMDDFMRMAGVVKESVACYERDDCQTQLVDLNRDCWLCIRRYLNVGDILDEEPV